MYRFYCTVCKKVKRVQKRPILIENSEHGNPSMRLGECNKHSSKLYKHAKNQGMSDSRFNQMRKA